MKKLIKKAIDPIRIFLNDSRCVGVILIVCTIISLLLANSGVSHAYLNAWHEPFLPSALHSLPSSSGQWINDFLMAFFFLLAGMEIKRELTTGELSTLKHALLPFGAAVGGMLFPALIFAIFNGGNGFAHGWGIPTATDIAFSLGIASLLGKKVPVSLKILLMALAIIDDLGAIIVVAVFYGGKLNWMFLAIAAGLFVALLACNRFKLKFGALQIVLSLALWYSVFNAGIEASISGVLVALTLPASILPRIEKAIHGAVNFFILPIFALANTAIVLPDNMLLSLKSPVSIGIICGLVLGKPIGIFLVSRVMIALKIARLPAHIRFSQIIGMGAIAGIGFTMSIFTTNLAFPDTATQDIAKIAILTSVVLSCIVSFVYFNILEPSRKPRLSMPNEINIDFSMKSRTKELETAN